MFQQFNGVEESKTVIQDKYFLPHQPLKNITQPPLRSRPEPMYTLPEVTLKQTGESGQKDKLLYLSLAQQDCGSADQGGKSRASPERHVGDQELTSHHFWPS